MGGKVTWFRIKSIKVIIHLYVILHSTVLQIIDPNQTVPRRPTHLVHIVLFRSQTFNAIINVKH